jgi:hypothetical protein
MENILIPKYTLGEERAVNKQYRMIINQKRKYKRCKNWEKVKEIKKTTQMMASKDPMDPDFRRLYYIRYADDVLLGFSGSKKGAQEIKAELTTYLQTELKLQLSQDKTLITHARSEKARFLGYDVHALHDNTKHDSRGHRSINGAIGLRVPKDKMQAKMSKYMAKGKPTHRMELTIYSDYDIVSQYQSEFRGFVQYYTQAYNAYQMQDVKRVMELSLVKTLVCKHKLSMNKVFRRYRAVVETMCGRYRVL